MILFFSSDLFKQYVLSYHKDDLTTILLEEDETEHYAVNIEWVVFLLILNEECYSIKVRFFSNLLKWMFFKHEFWTYCYSCLTLLERVDVRLLSQHLFHSSTQCLLDIFDECLIGAQETIYKDAPRDQKDEMVKFTKKHNFLMIKFPLSLFYHKIIMTTSVYIAIFHDLLTTNNEKSFFLIHTTFLKFLVNLEFLFYCQNFRLIY